MRIKRLVLGCAAVFCCQVSLSSLGNASPSEDGAVQSVETQAYDLRQRPNVILMMADDMGMGDSSAYQDFTGNTDSEQLFTPNMERLARMGVRFTDAHTPASRCTTTRYGLLTGRYAFRGRLKHFVLFGVQGDPLIETDRPTLGTLMQSCGYRTGLFGKWHVGLRYRQSDGRPAAEWTDAELTEPMFDTPLDHGFDVCQFTSRSHGTSGIATAGRRNGNGPKQSTGPGHIAGRMILSATGNGKQLVATGKDAYILPELGGRHSDNVLEFLKQHAAGAAQAGRPFFVYYPSNSNHSPYTPDTEIGGVPVAGHGRSNAGDKMGQRGDFVYENDIALGRLLDYLETQDDPRRPGHKLIENTIVIFTSDNGAEKADKTATGPFRSNKGSCYEGGHRVPFLVAWSHGGVGDGNAQTPGQTNPSLIGLQDMFATLADILGAELPDLGQGEKGAEDSQSVLAAWRGGTLSPRPMFFHDHKDARDDPAVAALRLDNPNIQGSIVEGQWKLFFDASLLRHGKTQPKELFDLATDPAEQSNRLGEPRLESLVDTMTKMAALYRNSGGHRLAVLVGEQVQRIDFANATDVRKVIGKAATSSVRLQAGDVTLDIVGRDSAGHQHSFILSDEGLGLSSGDSPAFDAGDSLTLTCNKDVVVESIALVAGGKPCGGLYQVGQHAPLQVYCVDADIDSQDQSGVLSDIGVLRAGQEMILSTQPFLDVETPGQWYVQAVQLRQLKSPSVSQ